MKDRALKKNIHYVLLAGLSLVVLSAALYVFLGGVWGKISLGILLALPPLRLVIEVHGFAKTKLYGFMLISLTLILMLFTEFIFLG
ncbi:hypothetical protein Emin_1149 [Elusimicrobium minutum Pei191]|uniref:Uncharacterized protein n=1 Tax=Elusimicrobium minutum (strain Pei191) TaxID=445932 RepID=B2KDV5_ELUMP|nr:hypothetical protein [Elusimicrobium minutum]ACC98701.1 hypothetical protein Emin_1149 [Elusimicrobium minutum Pei191]